MSDRIHPPTPRRRQRAREQGRAPRSSDVVSAGLLLATTALLSHLGPKLTEAMTAALGQTLQQPAVLSLDPSQAYQLIVKAMAAIAAMVLPMLVAMMMCGVGLNLLQTGAMMTPSKLAPSLDRISPLARMKSILSARSLGRFLITALKLVAVIAVSISVLRNQLPEMMGISGMPIDAIASTIFSSLVECCFWIGMTLLLFACVDYSLARWQHERDLMMTEQELRDEMRDAQRSRPPASARAQAVQRIT